ncbi:precorrin-3B C17-methyltransferase [Ammonifex degensii KC4]|uniref:Precorrin-3B C17-methyltransferase n=1 Tax=Ammonifex degensii (strain DSM 10501 / KC4) TaxID=429009 RepID=C9RCU5_AMMDK|nr:precorrin-3B C17-methyltransferase [Ammonifex degensii KC4]
MGIGPGSLSDLTFRAAACLEEAEVIIGYRPYLESIAAYLKGKEVFPGRMREELERAREAVLQAQKGKRVAVVSGGDPGVYGMAVPVLQAALEEGVAVEVIPGVTAATAVAACLGAPLGHDFAVVSLSDLLTPWPLILRRLKGALAADFVLVLYNPSSSRRQERWREAVEVIKGGRDPDTPVGIVWEATRPSERKVLTTVGEMEKFPVDMRSLVIVGNSQTYVAGGLMITPRGYERK